MGTPMGTEELSNECRRCGSIGGEWTVEKHIYIFLLRCGVYQHRQNAERDNEITGYID